MPWTTTNLSGALGGLALSANESIKEVQKKLNILNSQVEKLNRTLSSAMGAVTGAKSTLSKLAESGFYMVTLAPKRGAWTSRLSSAENAPPSAPYSCGVATISISENLAVVTDAYEKMIEATKKPMADAKNLYDAFDFSDYLPDPDPEELEEMEEAAAKDWADLFTSDEWKIAALGDIFGGYSEGLAKATNALSKDARSIQAGKNQASKSISAINKGLNATKTLLCQMDAAGVYKIILEPAEGNYLSRLRSEMNAPPTSANLCTSGYVCIAVASDPSTLASKFETLGGIVGI